MGMRPGRKRLKGPKVSGKWKSKLRRSGEKEGWNSDYARSQRLLNDMARNMWFEKYGVGGGWSSPGMMAEMFDTIHESAQRKHRANRRMFR
jgi:hypothetical protein